MRHLWTAWPSLHKMFASFSQILLILDFDGTLTRIASSPSKVIFEKEAHDALARLSRRRSCKLAVVSGRSLKDLMSFFRIKNIIYSGNHGLELSAGKIRLPSKANEAKKYESLIWLLGEKLNEEFDGVSGIWVENKGYTLSLHYRNMPKTLNRHFNAGIRRIKTQVAHWPIIWKRGKMVWEARPSVQWNKGDIAQFLHQKYPHALPIVIGDDVTDEDMFKALERQAVTIRVGRSQQSCAKYFLASPRAVLSFLETLADNE